MAGLPCLLSDGGDDDGLGLENSGNFIVNTSSGILFLFASWSRLGAELGSRRKNVEMSESAPPGRVESLILLPSDLKRKKRKTKQEFRAMRTRTSSTPKQSKKKKEKRKGFAENRSHKHFSCKTLELSRKVRTEFDG